MDLRSHIGFQSVWTLFDYIIIYYYNIKDVQRAARLTDFRQKIILIHNAVLFVCLFFHFMVILLYIYVYNPCNNMKNYQNTS